MNTDTLDLDGLEPRGCAMPGACSALAELTTLRAHLRQAVEALEPFAEVSEVIERAYPGYKDHIAIVGWEGRAITHGNLRCAHSTFTSLTAALGDQPPAPASTEDKL